MFRSQDTDEAPDPFPRPWQRTFRAPTGETFENMVAQFELSQPKEPENHMSRATAGRKLHRLAKDADVCGTVYEKVTKVWKAGCKYDEVTTLKFAIHGSTVAICEFGSLMKKKMPHMYSVSQRNFYKPGLKCWLADYSKHSPIN